MVDIYYQCTMYYTLHTTQIVDILPRYYRVGLGYNADLAVVACSLVACSCSGLLIKHPSHFSLSFASRQQNASKTKTFDVVQAFEEGVRKLWRAHFIIIIIIRDTNLGDAALVANDRANLEDIACNADLYISNHEDLIIQIQY